MTDVVRATYPRIRLESDTLIVVEYAPAVDEVTTDRVCSLARAARAAAIPSVTDIVPAISSLAFHVDPVRVDWDRLTAWVEQHMHDAPTQSHDDRTVVDVPVTYGGVGGPDLQDVARACGRVPEEVIALHTGSTYRVLMMGFTPGFAYLGPLPASLSLPRRAEPRTRVPAGSVAIAGEFTGIYPSATPGGWHLIGVTTLKPFDLHRDPPFALQTGQRVRFRAVGSPG